MNTTNTNTTTTTTTYSINLVVYEGVSTGLSTPVIKETYDMGTSVATHWAAARTIARETMNDAEWASFIHTRPCYVAVINDRTGKEVCTLTQLGVDPMTLHTQQGERSTHWLSQAQVDYLCGDDATAHYDAVYDTIDSCDAQLADERAALEAVIDVMRTLPDGATDPQKYYRGLCDEVANLVKKALAPAPQKNKSTERRLENASVEELAYEVGCDEAVAIAARKGLGNFTAAVSAAGKAQCFTREVKALIWYACRVNNYKPGWAYRQCAALDEAGSTREYYIGLLAARSAYNNNANN